MSDVSQQLEILGLDESLRLAAAEGRTASVRSRLTNRIETVHDLLSAVPTIGDLSFLHSGLAQTCLPHSRPDFKSPILEASVRSLYSDCSARSYLRNQTKLQKTKTTLRR